jgi:hypothetical protein
MLSYFNRLINIKRFVRKLRNGKEIIVKPHSRRAIVSRLKEGLEDLRKNTNDNALEYGYLFNTKNGKLGQRITGKYQAVDLYNQLPNREKNLSKKSYLLHSHPMDVSLSMPDLFNSKGRMIFAVTPSGDIYRGYGKPKLYDNSGYIENKVHTIAIKYASPPDSLGSKETDTVAMHTIKRLMSKDDFIFYRSKLTPKTKDLLEKHKDLVKTIEKDWRLFDIKKNIHLNRSRMRMKSNVGSIDYQKEMINRGIRSKKKDPLLRKKLENKLLKIELQSELQMQKQVLKDKIKEYRNSNDELADLPSYLIKMYDKHPTNKELLKGDILNIRKSIDRYKKELVDKN